MEPAVPPRCILYTSDCHGNNAQYRKVVAAAVEMKVAAVMFGGDLSPKCQYRSGSDYYGRMQREQRAWLLSDLRELMTPLRAAGIPVFMIVGNGDVSANYDVHVLNEREGLYTMVDCRRVALFSLDGVEYDLVGLPYVPFSGSSMKDFEVHDLATADYRKVLDVDARAMLRASFEPWRTYYEDRRSWPCHSREQRTPEAFRVEEGAAGDTSVRTAATRTGGEGVRGTSAPHRGDAGWQQVGYAPERAGTHSLEVFLRSEPFHPVAGRRTIMMAHSPPFATNADLCFARTDSSSGSSATAWVCEWCDKFGLPHTEVSHIHAGSVAIRQYCASARPWVTLHGHLHDTATLSGTIYTPMSHPHKDGGGSAGVKGDTADLSAVTHILCSGNDPLYTEDGTREGRRIEVPRGEEVAAVLFDVRHPGEARHLML